MEYLFDVGAIIMADLILSGDNALIIGMAAAGLSPRLRPRAILYGMAIAAILRIVFAIIATELLAVPGLLFVGGLLLVWVCLRLYRDILAGIDERAEVALQAVENPSVGYTGAPRRSLTSALISITIADVSMSLDNVLAVAAIAAGNKGLLIDRGARRPERNHQTPAGGGNLGGMRGRCRRRDAGACAGADAIWCLCGGDWSGRQCIASGIGHSVHPARR